MMFPGGNSINVPVLAQRYGHSGSYIGCFGNDDHGRLLMRSLEREGVDISQCRLLEGPNAFCEVSIKNGERIFGDFSAGVRDQLVLSPSDLAFIGEHDITHSSIYSSLESQLLSIRNVSTLLSFDFSSDWKSSYLTEILPIIDIAFLSYGNSNLQEVKELMQWAHKQGPKFILITQGELGAFIYDGKSIHHQPAVETEVIDSLGAGDAFAARFIVECLGGESLETAMGRAAESAAETCSYYGAFGHGISLAN
jgi:fructoselysine 6-kinase